MEKTYSLEEIKKALDETMECLEKAIKLADEVEDETSKEDKETVKYITLGTAKVFKKQVLERLTVGNTLQGLLDKLTEMLS